MPDRLGRVILISGTTSGIGFELARQSLDIGLTVIGVDRSKAVLNEHNFFSYQIDITSVQAVIRLLKSLTANNLEPQTFVLNAGVNKLDNEKELDIETLRNVYDINFFGSINFVSAAQKLGMVNKTFLAVSSTSNIVPNPAALGYYLSKKNLSDVWRLLQPLDHKNTYKTAIISPVKTNISRDNPALKGINLLIFNALVINADVCAKKILFFLKNEKSVLKLTMLAYWFYKLVSFVLLFFPFIYTGSRVVRRQENNSSKLD